jgi:hypothetical protein
MPPKAEVKKDGGKDAKKGAAGAKGKNGKVDPFAEEKAAVAAKAAALEEEEEARLQAEAEAQVKAQAAALEEKLAGFAESLQLEAIHFAKDELAKEHEARRVAKVQDKLSAKGKVPVVGTVRAVVGGVVGEVRAYEPKEGRYIVELPSGALVKVQPSLLVRYRELPLPPVDTSVRSVYSSLKSW